MPDITTAIVAEAKRLEEDTLYSAKGHFNAASLWERVHMAVGGLATIAAALAAVFTLSHDDALVITLAVLASVSTGIMTFLNPNHIAASHRKSGTEYNAIHNNARIFHSIDCHSSATGDGVQDQVHADRHAQSACRQLQVVVPIHVPTSLPLF